LAYLTKDYWKADSEIFINIRDKKMKAKVTNIPLWRGQGEEK